MKQIPQGLLPVELMIDHGELDAQHNEIFWRIEALKESSLLADGVPHDDVAALISCFADHFATEEHLAQAAALDISAHMQEHERSLRVLRKADVDLGCGRLDLRTFLRYLEYWFEQHINEHDKPLGYRLGRSEERRLGQRRTATARPHTPAGPQASV